MTLLAALAIATSAFADDDPRHERHELMESVGDAAKPVGLMLRGETDFDGEVLMQSLKVWKDVAGQFGGLFGLPIINQPQVAILAIGTVEKKPAVIETPTGDVIGIRHKMFLSLTYDHRIIDGALGGAYLKRLGDYIESFDSLSGTFKF